MYSLQCFIFYFNLTWFYAWFHFNLFFQAQDSTKPIKALSHAAAPHLPRQWLPRAPWRATHTNSWSISLRTGLGCRNTVTVSSRKMDVLPSQLKPGQHNPAEQTQELPKSSVVISWKVLICKIIWSTVVLWSLFIFNYESIDSSLFTALLLIWHNSCPISAFFNNWHLPKCCAPFL